MALDGPLEVADAIVVGAGHNGLVAANVLADAGWDVLVLEATGRAGGAVCSGEITAPGYLSDLCSAFYPLGLASPALRELGLDEYGLRWRHAPDVLAHLLPDGRSAVLNRDVDTTARSVEAFAPGDGDRWRTAYAQWRNLSEPLLAGLFSPFPPVRPGVALLRALRTAGLLRLARQFLLPARVLGEELFTGDGAKLLLAGCALHTDLSTEEPGSGVYGWLLTMLGQQFGFPVPEGGAQQLSNALVARLLARGGRIAYGTRVERVVVSRGRAIGVTSGGRGYRARKAVLADVPAPALYLDLVGAAKLPPRLVEDLTHFRWDGATLKIDWALSGKLPWLDPAVAGAGTLHIGGDLDDLTRYSAALATGELPERPFLLVGQMTTSDPSRSPAGTESLWAYTHLPRRPQWTEDDLLPQIERVESTMEQAAPGFGQLVVARHVAGPADLERKNPSLVGGAIGGGTSAAYQQLIFRPIPGLGRADTPIDRLYLASASAHPGGGVHGVSGSNAARAALARDRAVTGAVYKAGIRAAQRAIYR